MQSEIDDLRKDIGGLKDFRAILIGAWAVTSFVGAMLLKKVGLL